MTVKSRLQKELPGLERGKNSRQSPAEADALQSRQPFRGTVPSSLEVVEGAAYLRRLKFPADLKAVDEHILAFNAMQRAGEGKGCWRCAQCGVLVSGRVQGDPCGSCGEILRSLAG